MSAIRTSTPKNPTRKTRPRLTPSKRSAKRAGRARKGLRPPFGVVIDAGPEEGG
jgi:hypothetical protein